MFISKRDIGWLSSSATILYGTAAGSMMLGFYGGIGGFLITSLDEYLIRNNYFDKHYFTISSFWSTTVFTPVLSNILPNSDCQKILYMVSYALSGAISYLSDDFLNFREHIEIPINSFFTLNKIFDDKNIFSKTEFHKIHDKFTNNPYEALEIVKNDSIGIYENKFINNFVLCGIIDLSKTMIDNLLLYFLIKYSSGLSVNYFINNNIDLINNSKNSIDTSSWNFLKLPNNLLFEISKIVIVELMRKSIDYIYNHISSHISNNLSMEISKKAASIINDEGGKIIADEYGEEIIENLNNDLFDLAYKIFEINNFLIKSSNSLFSLNIISTYLKDAFAPYILTSLPKQIFNKYISQERKKSQEKEFEIYNKFDSLKYDMSHNIVEVKLRNGNDFMKYKYDSIANEVKFNKNQSEFYNKISELGNNSLDLLGNILNILYYLKKIIGDEIDIAEIFLINKSTNDLYDFVVPDNSFITNNQGIDTSYGRLKRLLDIINKENDSTANHISNDEKKIIYKNYSLNIEDKRIVKIDLLELDHNKHYAVTGKSGCGKTSSLKDIKSGLFGELMSKGEIYIGYDQSKIMFIDQKIYMPAESSLLESIYFPNIIENLDTEQREIVKDKITNLLREIEIDEHAKSKVSDIGIISKLDNINYNINQLSGGQLKKIAVIQAILNQPEVLIMDETFTGLDKISLFKTQQMIEKYLPGILILSVDHHAEDNNYNEFYDFEINFSNGEATKNQISSKIFNNNIYEYDIEMNGLMFES